MATEAIKKCWTNERRAACGFQMTLSFGARRTEGHMEIDGVEVGSGFEAIKFLHTFFSVLLFGSVKEGSRHIYFDWYNLQGLPGTKETKRPDGSVSYLNDSWHELYVKAFNESKVLIFCISSAWLDSPNCFQELGMLFNVLRGDKNGSGDDSQCYIWIMDKGVPGHPNWAKFEKTMGDMCQEHSGHRNEWHAVLHDFTTENAQNKALCKLMYEFTQYISVQRIGDARPWKIDGKGVLKNYMAGCDAKVPGFNREQAPPADLKALAAMADRM